MAPPTDPTKSPRLDAELDVCGAVPPGLSGRLLGIDGRGVVHSVRMGAGRVSYRSCLAASDVRFGDLVAFGGSILAFGDDSPAHELSTDLEMLRCVDLAGRRRALASSPRHDPATGELHLLARDADGVQEHVVISAGALTRHSRPLTAAPSRIKDLVLSSDHCVFIADGRIGVASRDGEARSSWIATGVTAPHPVHAHDAGDAVAVLVLTPAVELWTLLPGARSIDRKVLDETPRRFAHLISAGVDETPHWLLSTGGSTIGRHDLVHYRHARHHSFGPALPGDFAIIPDSARPDEVDGCWVVALVHDPSGTTDLRVIDAADIAAPAVATARIPRPIQHGLRWTWIPSTQH